MTVQKRQNIISVVLIALMLLVLILHFFVVRIVIVSGESMLPTFKSGDAILALRVYDTSIIEADDIIVFRHDGRTLIKRVASVSDGSLYVLGDNAENSNDSRTFGDVPEEDVRFVYTGLKFNKTVLTICIIAILTGAVALLYAGEDKNKGCSS